MPLLAGLISSLFGAFFAVLAKRLTIGVAAAAAFIAVSAAAFAAAKLALFALFAGLSLVVPPQVVIALASFMPRNATLCVGVILLAQSIMVAYDYWRLNLSVAFQLARG